MPRFWHKRWLSGTSKKLRRSAAKTSVLPVQNPADIQNGKHVPSHSFERRCERTCFPVSFCDQKSFKPSSFKSKAFSYFIASATATATATVAPTMGLLPMPRKPIISTCAGTEEEPANCASECIRPMVSVMP